MAMNIKALGDGQLPAATGVLYTVPLATTTIVKTITVVNNDVVNRIINIYLRRSGALRRISSSDQVLGAGWKTVEDLPHTLEAGDTIEGDADAAAIVDYTIDGVEHV